jgi:hypothetical protein
MVLGPLGTYRNVEEYEREFLEDVIANMSASIANAMREYEDRFVESDDRLTSQGRMYVQGYLTGQLSMLRGGSAGNTNLSVDDIEGIQSVVESNEAGIVAQLYA